MTAITRRYDFGYKTTGKTRLNIAGNIGSETYRLFSRVAIVGILATVAVTASFSSLGNKSAPAFKTLAISKAIVPVSSVEKRLWYKADRVRIQDDEFRISHLLLEQRNISGTLQKFLPLTLVPTFEQKPGNIISASWRDPLPGLGSQFEGPLAGFREKLAALQSGERNKPIVIVHLGDSHISSDSFSKNIRRRLQRQFGNAGRGAVIPANAYKYAIADKVSLSSSGSWRSFMSLKSSRGIFGLSGVRAESTSSSASMTLKVKQKFDSAQVTVATGPDQGSFDIIVGGIPKRFSAKSTTRGSRTFVINRRGNQVEIRPAGNGRLGVLHWATSNNNPGVRYINFGQAGATVKVTKRWNSAALMNDLATLKPDLIIYGFGTNEGFDDNIKPREYKSYVKKFLQQLKAGAPQADLMLIGASDGLRRRKGKSCGNGWFVPKNLGAIRSSMKALADEMSAGYWNWSAQMGGECGINKWAISGYAAKDRVHLTPKGYERSAAAFYRALVGPLDSSMLVANMR